MKKKIPTSSYRLQLSKDFDFAKAADLLPYLKELGVEMVYTSPYFEVVKGLNNPYMIISFHQISSELGGEKAFETFCKKCKEHKILHMMDIVPNHMAANTENLWWNDVVEKNESSEYAPFFDIDWAWGKGKVIRPGMCFNIHEEINYRRFFDICEMVGINIENEALYKLFFLKISSYVKKGWIHGFRIDHIDGLKDPKTFLEKVRDDFPDLYITLEKIVQQGESIRPSLLCDGSVGYDILFLIDQILLDPSGEKKIMKLWEKNKEEDVDLAKIKIDYLNHYLISEVNRFASYFKVPKSELLLFLANFPLYRTYIDHGKIDIKDEEAILYAASFTKTEFFSKDIFEKEHREALIKLQQILPAVFAKGFEDTYHYRYTPLVSLNEVGGDPHCYSLTNKEFFDHLNDLYINFPYTMHTLSTHDTKRSLDARMRVHVLSELPDEYKAAFKAFKKKAPSFESSRVVYFFFQNLIAISNEDLKERMTSYMIKAMREGKYYSDHLSPNAEFEDRLKAWIEEVLENSELLDELKPFKEKVTKIAEKKALSAIALQIGLFGVMDLYQGEELTNANLVDPDNRRPVNFDLRKSLIGDNSSPKMALIKKGLHLRSSHRDLILHGSFALLDTKPNQVGYKRALGDKQLTITVHKTHANLPKDTLPYTIEVSKTSTV